MDTNVVYHQDCIEGMASLPSKSIDMILCDLPYGTTRNEWDYLIPLGTLWEEYERIIKDNGAIVLFSQMPFGARLICSNEKMFRYEIIYRKNNVTGFLNAHKMPLKVHENILVFYKKLPTYNPQKTYFRISKPVVHYNERSINKNSSTNYGTQSDYIHVDDGSRMPIDIIEFDIPVSKNSTHNKKYDHPTQKPVALCEYLIKTYTNEGDIVLDNCMGSGTTAIAAIRTKRQYIGFEIEQKYFDIINERIREEVRLQKRKLF